MVLDAETVIDRRRLRRRLTAVAASPPWCWRCSSSAPLADRQPAHGRRRRSFLPHIARVSVSGIITDDRKMLELIDKVGKSEPGARP